MTKDLGNARKLLSSMSISFCCYCMRLLVRETLEFDKQAELHDHIELNWIAEISSQLWR